MATQDEVRSVALGLPGAVEGVDGFGFSVEVKGKHKGFLWTWRERVHPKKPKELNEGVLAVVVPGLLAKQMILESDSSAFFTEDHYNNFPAVLVRLDAISIEELAPLTVDAWKCKAPPALVKGYRESNEMRK